MQNFVNHYTQVHCLSGRASLFPKGYICNVVCGCRRFHKTVKRESAGKTHYDILGLPRDCSRKDIRLAFVRLSKECHPDRNSNDPSCHVKFVELNEAYAVLVKPDSRSRYDYYLANLIRNPPPEKNSWNAGNAASSNWAQDAAYQNRHQSRDYGFWETRDKSEDKYYEGKPYYGVKGVKKLPHWLIVVGCCIFLVLGATGHYFAISYGNRVSREAQDKKDVINSKLLNESRRRAHDHGNEHQLEWLKNNIKKE